MSIQPIFNNMASGDARVIFVGWNATGNQICSQIRDLWNLDPDDAIANNAIKHNDVSGDPFFSLCVSLIGSGEHPLESTICDLGCTQINGAGQVTQQYHVIAGYIPGGCLLVRHNEKNIPFDEGWKEDHRLQHTMWQMPETVPLATPTAFNYWDRFEDMATVRRKYETLNRDLEKKLAAATEQKARAEEAFRNAKKEATEFVHQLYTPETLGWYMEDGDATRDAQIYIKKSQAEAAKAKLEAEKAKAATDQLGRREKLVEETRALTTKLETRDQDVESLQETLNASQAQVRGLQFNMRILEAEHKGTERRLRDKIEELKRMNRLPFAALTDDTGQARDKSQRRGVDGPKGAPPGKRKK